MEQQVARRDTKEFALNMAQIGDFNTVFKKLYPDPKDYEERKWRKLTRTEEFRKMVREELQSLLLEKGYTEGVVLDLLEEALNMARGKTDITNFLRIAENMQDMLGMRDKQITKTTQISAGQVTQNLLNEISDEERKLAAMQKIETVEETTSVTPKLEAQGSGGTGPAKETAQTEEVQKEI